MDGPRVTLTHHSVPTGRPDCVNVIVAQVGITLTLFEFSFGTYR